MNSKRNFLDLTDEEIRSIVADIFDPVKIENIQRDEQYNEFTLDITTDGWEIDENEYTEITDEITLRLTGISADFSLSNQDISKWRQFLKDKGIR